MKHKNQSRNLVQTTQRSFKPLSLWRSR